MDFVLARGIVVSSWTPLHLIFVIENRFELGGAIFGPVKKNRARSLNQNGGVLVDVDARN